MAIWVGKQKMSCRSCIKGHRSSTCNHFGGPLWAVRPAGRPNKACIHGPGDLCLCAHYFPLTWLKAAVPRKQKCSCHGSGSARSKCQCGGGGAAAAAAAAAAASTPPEDETQPIFYQDLVARGLQITTEPVDFDAPPTAPSSCCSAPAAPPVQAPLVSMPGSCCSGRSNPSAPPLAQLPLPTPTPTPSLNSSNGSGAVKPETSTPNPSSHIKSESTSAAAPFTPVQQQFHPLPDFPVMKFTPPHHAAVTTAGNGPAADTHVCECGPSCNCVLCIDHPYNTATMNHIATEFGQMMSAPPRLSPPRHSNRNNTTNGANSPTNGNGNGHGHGHHHGHRHDLSWQGWNGMMPPGFNDASFMSGQPQQSHSPPQQASDMDIILNPADFQMFNFAWPPPEGGFEDEVYNQHQQQQHQQQNHQQQHHHHFEEDMQVPHGMPDMDIMDLNGFCGGATEVCPCGDECACIGCQIHKPTNGHVLDHANGIAPGWR